MATPCRCSSPITLSRDGGINPSGSGSHGFDKTSPIAASMLSLDCSNNSKEHKEMHEYNRFLGCKVFAFNILWAKKKGESLTGCKSKRGWGPNADCLVETAMAGSTLYMAWCGIPVTGGVANLCRHICKQFGLD